MPSRTQHTDWLVRLQEVVMQSAHQQIKARRLLDALHETAASTIRPQHGGLMTGGTRQRIPSTYLRASTRKQPIMPRIFIAMLILSVRG